MSDHWPAQTRDRLRWGGLRPRPTGSPVPLLALLPRRLMAGEVQVVADRVLAEARTTRVPVTLAQVGGQITRVTDELPRADDLALVVAVLAERGTTVSARQRMGSS
jgi:hypothetical protein